MLDIKSIEKTFNAGTVNQKKALNGLSLHLEEGDFVTVIGGNGAGKSTMMNAIAGVFSVDKGEITINNVNVTKFTEHKRAQYIGRVFQDPMMGTCANMQIEENLSIASRRGQTPGLRWSARAKDRAFFKERLSMLGLGLEERLTDRVGLLSGGQRQALTLLMATLKRPDILLLDEHTAALDPKTAAKVLEITDQIVGEYGFTTIMITHNMRDAINHGNRLVMLDSGRVVVDIKKADYPNLSVQDLLQMFEKASGDAMLSDGLLLS